MVLARATCAHVTRVRAARVRISHCVVVMLFVAFVFGLLCPVRAYAAGSYSGDWYSILYQSNMDGAEQYIVGADDKWQAAAIICGKSKSFIDGLDDTTRHKLATNGGSFQTLAESLTKVWPGWNEETLEDSLSEVFGGGAIGSLWFNMTNAFTVTSTYPFVGFNSSALSLFTVAEWQQECPISIFAINLDPSLRAAAIEALNIIVDGGSIGGGNQPDANGDFALELYGQVYNQKAIVDSGSSILKLSGNAKTFYDNNKEQYPYVYVSISGALNDQSSTRYGYGSFFMTDKQATFTTTTSDNGYNYYDGVSRQWVMVYRRSVQIDFQSDATVKYMGITTSNVSWNNTFPTEFTCSANTAYDYTGDFTNNVEGGFFILSQNGGGNNEPVGPNPWPVPDPPTEPPNVPEPPVVDPDPIGGPVFPTNPPDDPTTTPEPEPTGTDYTVYLLAIIRQLNQVMVQMSNHCKHIRDQISTSANAIISNMHTFIGDLQESIDSNFAALNDYLEDLTTWYEDFTQEIVDGIQDEFSTVESILRQILRRIGIGRGTQKDVEKDVDDDFNFLEWLINFITSKLSGVIGDFVGDVGGLIAGVKDKFPFSIPWDIAAILALLDGVPTTPVFTITIPAINGWWQETRFVIDLHPFDSVASAARIMINAWWVLVLVMKTNWLLMIMGDSTSIGERIANRMTGGE